MPPWNRLRRWIAVAAVVLLPAIADAAVPHLVKDLNPAGASSASQILLATNGLAYFSALDAAGNKALWATDGTVGGTVRLTAFPVGAYWEPYLTPIGGVVFFLNAVDGMTELWRSDGTAAGTARVAALVAGPASSYPQNFAVMNGLLYFTATDAATGFEIWASDGTAAGTARVTDANPGSGNFVHGTFTVWNGVLYFNGYTPAT